MIDCIFCKIIKGEIPSTKVFEDEKTLAFFDINPLTKGHTLVVPKGHYEDVFNIPIEDLKFVIANAKNIAKNLKNSLGASGVNLVNASGEVAGQSVLHFHIHVIPRYYDDKLEFTEWWQSKTKSLDGNGLKSLAEEIKSKNH